MVCNMSTAAICVCAEGLAGGLLRRFLRACDMLSSVSISVSFIEAIMVEFDKQRYFVVQLVLGNDVPYKCFGHNHFCH